MAKNGHTRNCTKKSKNALKMSKKGQKGVKNDLKNGSEWGSGWVGGELFVVQLRGALWGRFWPFDFWGIFWGTLVTFLAIFGPFL